MTSVRKTEAWTAYDGTMHKNERGALLASVDTILGTSGGGIVLTQVSAENIDKNLPALLPLFNRLMSPGNRPDEEKAQRSANTREKVGSTDGQRVEVTTCEDSERRFIDAVPGILIGPPEIDPDDLRTGQEVEFTDGATAVIKAIVCDNQPEPVIECEPLPGEEYKHYAHVSDIIRVLSQPEDRLSLKEAESILKELGEAEDGKLSDLDAAKLHKRRILLHRRIETLKAGEE